MWTPFEKKPQHRLEYVPDKGLAYESRLSASLDGLLWSRCPLPPRNHTCWPQTLVTSLTRPATFRCACGAWSPNGKTWVNRNGRRKDRWRERKKRWLDFFSREV